MPSSISAPTITGLLTQRGADAQLVIEVGDAERKPRDKMRAYMRDGRIATAWRVDVPGRCVDIWQPANAAEPSVVLRGADGFGFADVTFTVDEVFRTVLAR